jgi:hypothetical protein
MIWSSLVKREERRWRGAVQKQKKRSKHKEMRKKGVALGIRVCVHLIGFFVLLFKSTQIRKERVCVREKKLNSLIIFLYCKTISI